LKENTMNKRYLVPLAGVLLVTATVVQVRASRTTPAEKPAIASHAPEQEKISAEGRVAAYPGSEITIGSDVAGVIDQVLVDEKDVVKKGQTIAIVRADDSRASLNEARFRVREAEADMRLFELERERAAQLFHEAVGSRQAVDRAERDLDTARARRESATAEVRRLEAVVAKSVITSPIDGTITARMAHPGEAIASGAEIVTVADLANTRVEAEIDEYDAARVNIGSQVTVSAEGYSKSWKGTVEEIPDSVISRRLKPQDPAKPIDTRVLLVKVRLDEATPLKLGQRVEVGVAAK
jgi:HlyD family secretion protein